MTLPILIVGAGIAGLTLALELASRNIPTRVIERAPILKDIGAGLQLPPNASRILDRHPGIAEALDAVSTQPEALRFIDGRTGSSIARMPLGEAALTRWGAPYRVIHRASLQRVLLEAVQGAGIHVKPRTELIGLTDGAGGLTAQVRIDDQEEIMEAAAIVGADGLHSNVRQLIAPDSHPRYTGHTAWRAIIDTRSLPSAPRVVETGLWLGPQAHLVHYPISGGEHLNMVAITRGGENDTDPEALKQAFASWCPQAKALIHRARDWKPWPLFERDGRGIWGHGRVTLLGDAAHAMLPHLAQGAAQAIEDAGVLAAKLAGNPGNPGLALRYYEHDRRSRAVAVQAQSRRNGQIYQLSRPASLARNTVLRVSGANRLMARVDWLYAADAL